jgi:multimeric flavodoxin WrbA
MRGRTSVGRASSRQRNGDGAILYNSFLKYASGAEIESHCVARREISNRLECFSVPKSTEKYTQMLEKRTKPERDNMNECPIKIQKKKRGYNLNLTLIPILPL